MQKLLFAAILCGAVIWTAGFVPSDKKAGYRIALALYDTSPVYVQTWLDAIQQHPAVTAGTVRLGVFNGTGNRFTQDEQFQTILTLGYDAIILVANDQTFSKYLVDMAAHKGVPVIASCAPIESAVITSLIAADDEEAGYLTAKAVMEEMGGRGNAVILTGPPEQGSVMQRDAGIARALTEYPDVRILDAKPANWKKSEALHLMQHWLVSYHDNIDGVIAQNDEMALGAAWAILTEGEKHIPVAGIDGTAEALQAVRDGILLQTLRQDAEIQAQGALDIALREVIGPNYQPHAAGWLRYPELSWRDGTEKNYLVPWTTVRQ